MNKAAFWLTRQWMRRGWAACLLWPLHALMTQLVRRRRQAYQDGRRASHDLGVPVLVVGNRVVGGAGKTPTVLAVLAHLRQQGWQPGVLSRGYGRVKADATHPVILDASSAGALDAGGVGDECWLIWRRARVPMGIAADRVAAGRALRAAHPEIDILVCDDGLQHWALQRQIEIVVFDERGVGNGWLLPAGLLREPVDAPPGPGCRQPPLVLYNASRPTTALPGHLVHKGLRPLQAWQDWALGQPLPAQVAIPGALQASGPDHVVAIAGIAQPGRFFQALEHLGLRFTPRPLPDHAPLRPLPWPESARHVVMTEKDAVKLDADVLLRERPATQAWVAALDFQPEPAFWQALDERLAALPGAPVPAAEAPPRL